MGRPPGCNCGCGEVIEPDEGCEWTDDFSSTQSGYTTYTLANSSEAPVFTVGSGTISVTNGTPVASGTYYRTVSLNPSGLKTLSVQAKVTGSGSQRVGVFIGYTYGFYARFSGSNFAIRDSDSVGETDNDAETTFGSGLVSGDTIKMQLQETSSGIFDVTFYRNGSLINTLSAQPLSVPELVNVGLYCELGGGWDDLVIACDETDACPLGTYAVVYSATISGVQNGTCAACNDRLNRTHYAYFCDTTGAAPNRVCRWRTPPQDKWCASVILGTANVPLHVYVLETASSVAGVNRYAVLTVNGTLTPSCQHATSFAVATYYLNEAFAPLGNNSFTLYSVQGNGGCTNFPSTITLSPA